MPSLTADGRRLNGKGSSWITPHKRLAIYLRDGFLCGYCGRDLHTANPREVSLDHLTPRVRGGTNDATNLITACLSCNSRRQDARWTTYAPAGAVARIKRVRRRALPLELAKAIRNGTVDRATALAESLR